MPTQVRKTFKGNPPEGSVFVARFGEEGKWLLYFRNQTEGFANMKLVFDGRHLDKANFWMGYCIQEEAFSAHKDTVLLMKQHPALFKEVLEWMRGAAKPDDKQWVRAAVLRVQAG